MRQAAVQAMRHMRDRLPQHSRRALSAHVRPHHLRQVQREDGEERQSAVQEAWRDYHWQRGLYEPISHLYEAE